MTRFREFFALGLALIAAAPVSAQPGPPPGGRPERPMPEHLFPGMSPAGRQAMLAALRPGGEGDRADHDRVQASRDRMLALLTSDRLDTLALRRAMDDERAAANAMRARRQAALLSALQGLSLADRRAFVADARQMRGRFEGRIGEWRKHMRGRGGPDDGPPPMPPL